MIMTATIEFGGDGDKGFTSSNRFQEVKTAAYEHLLSRIEELGAEFGRWARSAIQEFVDIEVASFVRLRRVPINEGEMRQIAELTLPELVVELERRFGITIEDEDVTAEVFETVASLAAFVETNSTKRSIE